MKKTGCHSICLMNLPCFYPDVIFLFTCRWMRARKVQIICKASGRRSRFRLICRVDYNDNISWVNKTIYQNLPSVPMKQPWLTPGRNCGVKTHSAMSAIIFFFRSLGSLLPPHFPAVASMYHISLCFSCVALFEPGVMGWNKADPHFEADRVSKVWTRGQHLPSPPCPAPAWQRPRPTKVQFVTSF